MKVIFALAALVSVAVALPQYQQPNRDAAATILRQEFQNEGIDRYSYAYDTSNGQSQQESGQLQNAGTPNEALSVRGQFSYVGADNVQYTVNYVADENGFQPVGAHIPQV